MMHKGLILCVFSDNCVNFEQLGEECVGVALEHVDADVSCNVSVANVDIISLVKWPIKQITTLDNIPLQSYVSFDGMEVDEDYTTSEVFRGFFQWLSMLHQLQEKEVTLSLIENQRQGSL